MLFKSPVFSEASGSIAGITYSHNKGGMYTRARATPTNPQTSFQVAVRAAVGLLSQAWATELSAAELASWELYAANVPIINRLGEPKLIPAMAHYVRSNTMRIISAAGRIDTAPALFNLGGLTTPVPGAFVAGPPSTLSIAWTNTDNWAVDGTPANGRLFFFASRPQAPTINFFKGPYRYAGAVAGTDVSPVVANLPFNGVAGQRIFLRAIASCSDGRLSYPVTFRKDA